MVFKGGNGEISWEAITVMQGRDGSELEVGVPMEVMRNDWIKDLF